MTRRKPDSLNLFGERDVVRSPVPVALAEVAEVCHVSRQAVAKWEVRPAPGRGMIDAIDCIRRLHLQAINARDRRASSAAPIGKAADRIEEAKARLAEAKADQIERKLVRAEPLIQAFERSVSSAVYLLQQVGQDLAREGVLDAVAAERVDLELRRIMDKLAGALEAEVADAMQPDGDDAIEDDEDEEDTDA